VVIRFWKGRARPDHANAYRTHFTTGVLPKLRRIDGFVSAQLLERRSGDLVEFLVMTEWASWEAIRRFAGEEPGRAVVEPDAQRMLADYDATVDHFERARLE
jgi:heme-degrading monooxygenase HmoA